MKIPNLSSLTGLADIGLRSGVDMRPTLIRVLTDLYVQKLSHTADEDRHYTELALRLLDGVDTPTRVAVATRLAKHLAPPLRVGKRVGDAIEIGVLPAIVARHALHIGGVDHLCPRGRDRLKREDVAEAIPV